MKEPKERKECELGWLEPNALWQLGNVAGFGAKKYTPWSYLKSNSNYSTYYHAAQRHMMQFWDCQDNDEESGYSHLAHAAWNLLALLSYTILGLGVDDRPKKVIQKEEK